MATKLGAVCHVIKYSAKWAVGLVEDIVLSNHVT